MTIVAGALMSGGVVAHHAVGAFFDTDSPMEIEGTLVAASWQNPHVRLEVDDGAKVWTVESGGPTLLRRLGVTEDIVDVGEQVTISGYPSRVDDSGMIGVILGLEDGSSLPMFSTLAARFGHQLTSGVHITDAAIEESVQSAEGIFRVWTFGRTSNRPVPEFDVRPDALAAQAEYDPLVDDPALRCVPHSLPIVMDNPFPVQFTNLGDSILFELEIWDIKRTIHIGGDHDGEGFRGTPLGYSVGRWEDNNTLVVTTTDIHGLYIDDFGTPQSDNSEVVERFTLSEDETRLDYEVTVTDSEILYQPAVFGWHWEWTPGESLQSYNCVLH